MSLIGKKNIYTCTKEHKIVTIDIADGTTPMFIGCPIKGCGAQAQSQFYEDVNEKLTPAYEWFRPDDHQVMTEVRKLTEEEGDVDGFIDHLHQGGLIMRKHTPNENSNDN